MVSSSCKNINEQHHPAGITTSLIGPRTPRHYGSTQENILTPAYSTSAYDRAMTRGDSTLLAPVGLFCIYVCCNVVLCYRLIQMDRHQSGLVGLLLLTSGLFADFYQE